MKETVKESVLRAIISLALFMGIYFLSGRIIGWAHYDIYLKGIEFLAAVTGAGVLLDRV